MTQVKIIGKDSTAELETEVNMFITTVATVIGVSIAIDSGCPNKFTALITYTV